MAAAGCGIPAYHWSIVSAAAPYFQQERSDPIAMSLRTYLLFAVLCVFWGIPYFFIKLALADISPVCVAWSRITLGALVLIPVAWHRGALSAALRHKGAIVAFAIVELVVPFSLIAVAERWLTSSMVGVLIATVPLTVVVIAPLFGVH
jgi:drug/metabolite transporter (DMT)-like permease